MTVTTPSHPLSVVVIGSGNVGTALATNLRSLGHHVRIATLQPVGGYLW